MKKVLTEIQDGTFASEFLTEMSDKGGRKVHFLAERRIQAEHPIEKVGAELRGMMSWLKKYPSQSRFARQLSQRESLWRVGKVHNSNFTVRALLSGETAFQMLLIRRTRPGIFC